VQTEVEAKARSVLIQSGSVPYSLPPLAQSSKTSPNQSSGGSVPSSQPPVQSPKNGNTNEEEDEDTIRDDEERSGYE
jgi:hypothetical protein